VPKLLSLASSIFERSIALKPLAGLTKRSEIDPTCPSTLTKVLLQGKTRILRTLMDFFQSHQTVPAVKYLFHIPGTFNCTSKRLAGSPKGAEIDPNPSLIANKVASKVAHAFLYTLILSVAPNCAQAVVIFTFFHIFPERSIALVKRLVGSPKGAEIDPQPAPIKKCYPR
jgi:hypothetical protein